jgi:uncharacterized protein (TIGR00255 family)
MTGFAVATHPLGVSLDIRSVNSRFLDLGFKIPDGYRHLEQKLRSQISNVVKRGKCEVRLNVQGVYAGLSRSSAEIFQSNAIAALLAQQSLIKKLAPHAQELSVAELISLSSKSAEAVPEMPIDEANLLQLLDKALAGFNEARALEGGKLARVMLGQIAQLQVLRGQIAPLIPSLVALQKQRFLQKFHEALHPTEHKISAPILEERALTEATAFAIKVDITEEMDRLDSHLKEITRLLTPTQIAQSKSQEIGKRLEFLIQELHREVNTLGSKSASLETTQISVDMKVLVEQLREQVQNIE